MHPAALILLGISLLVATARPVGNRGQEEWFAEQRRQYGIITSQQINRSAKTSREIIP